MRHSISGIAEANVLQMMPSARPRSSSPGKTTKRFQTIDASDIDSISQQPFQQVALAPNTLESLEHQEINAISASIDRRRNGQSSTEGYSKELSGRRGSFKEPGSSGNEATLTSAISNDPESPPVEQPESQTSTIVDPGSLVNVLV